MSKLKINDVKNKKNNILLSNNNNRSNSNSNNIKINRNNITAKDSNGLRELLKVNFENKLPNINDLLIFCTLNKCSDLYLKAGSQPFISRYGLLYRIPTFELTNKIWQEWAKYAISSENNAKYVRQKMLDFSYSIPINIIRESDNQFIKNNISIIEEQLRNKSNNPDEDEFNELRYRVSAGFSSNRNIATFRMISIELPTFSDINFPSSIASIMKDVATQRSGITIIAGATGSGKSILYSQKLFIKRKEKDSKNLVEKEITWEELQIGDIFSDGSTVKEIMPWEERPCYELESINGDKIIVSDEHIIKCKYEIDNYGILSPILKYGNENIISWDTAKNIYDNLNNFNYNGVKKVWLVQESKNTYNYSNENDDNSERSERYIELKNIKIYKNGENQKVRCIRTDSGEYRIGDFINHNTTTFAACINDFSKKGEPFDNTVMISLEDPVEFKYKSTDSFYIMQKELGIDFKEFDLGVKQALREHPSYVNVGETRDKETIMTLVEAARTGHSCWTSFHSSDVADTISRLYNHLINFNSEIMYDLINNMNLILCQKLVPSDTGFQIQTQYMIFNNEIKNYLTEMINEKKNIPTEIKKLFNSQDLKNRGILKDWS